MRSLTSARGLAALLAAAVAGLAGCSGGIKSTADGAVRAPGYAAPAGTAAPYADDGTYHAGFATESDPARHPLSTFGMDVDTASYGYAASLIRQGRRPAPHDVRPEEFVNAFRQDYRQPEGNGFTVSVDGARLPASHRVRPAGDVRLVRVGLQTRAENPGARPDVALTFVVDGSGSMGEPGKLDVVRRALHALVDGLRPTDSVAIVAFSDEARVLRPMTRVVSRADLHAAVDDLAPGNSTNLEDGLVTGYRVAREGFRTGATNRVVLLSDGLANVGDTQAEPILARVREAAAKQVTLLGVGVGNEYGDELMERLADQGDGYVTYVSEAEQTRRFFVEQLPAVVPIRALDAKVQVTFDPRTVAGYRLIGYDDRMLSGSAFRDDRVDGGEVPAGRGVTALYTVRLREGTHGLVAHAQIRWLDPDDRRAHESGTDVVVADLDRDLAAAAPRLQVCYAAAYFAESLRHSPYATEVSPGDLARIAAAAARRTDDGEVSDLADLIRRAAG